MYEMCKAFLVFIDSLNNLLFPSVKLSFMKIRISAEKPRSQVVRSLRCLRPLKYITSDKFSNNRRHSLSTFVLAACRLVTEWNCLAPYEIL